MDGEDIGDLSCSGINHRQLLNIDHILDRTMQGFFENFHLSEDWREWDIYNRTKPLHDMSILNLMKTSK